MDALHLLGAVVQATEHWEADPRHARWDGAFVCFINAAGLKPPLLGAAANERIRPGLIDDLADRGLLRLLPHSSDGGIERKFAVTDEGRRQGRKASSAAAAASGAVDLSWPILGARLRDFVAAYEHAGAPERGIPLDEAGASAPHLRHLVATGHLERTEFSYDQLDLLRPTERAFALTRAWPSAQATAEAAFSDLLAALDRRDDAEAKSLRESLTTGTRDIVVEVIAGAITKQAGLG